MRPRVEIRLNGDAAEVDEGETLLDLLGRLDVETARVVVEHNHRVLRGADLEGVVLRADDAVEVVHFVGGG